jgi:hypothetical protein
MRLEHNGIYIGILRARVIRNTCLERFYNIASWFEKHGIKMQRFKDIEGFKMVMYGL